METKTSLTDSWRIATRWMFTAIVVLAVISWLLLDRNPTELVPLLSTVLGAVVAGEAANVGKRWTYKRDHHEVTPSPSGGQSGRDVRPADLVSSRSGHDGGRGPRQPTG